MNLILLESPHLELHLSCSQISLIPILLVCKIQRMKIRISSYLRNHMHTLYVIRDVLTMWHTQFQYIVAVISFLSSVMFEF
jgi:hypothetical protein